MKLETKRLILRGSKLADWKDIVEGVGLYFYKYFLNVNKIILEVSKS